jgi:hypothetical protein
MPCGGLLADERSHSSSLIFLKAFLGWAALTVVKAPKRDFFTDIGHVSTATPWEQVKQKLREKEKHDPRKLRIETIAALMRLEGDEANRLSRVVEKLNASIEAFGHSCQMLWSSSSKAEIFESCLIRKLATKRYGESNYLRLFVGCVATAQKIPIMARIVTEGMYCGRSRNLY